MVHSVVCKFINNPSFFVSSLTHSTKITWFFNDLIVSLAHIAWHLSRLIFTSDAKFNTSKSYSRTWRNVICRGEPLRRERERETEKCYLWHIAIELIFKHTWIDALEWFIHLACNYAIYDWLHRQKYAVQMITSLVVFTRISSPRNQTRIIWTQLMSFTHSSLIKSLNSISKFIILLYAAASCDDAVSRYYTENHIR